MCAALLSVWRCLINAGVPLNSSFAVSFFLLLPAGQDTVAVILDEDLLLMWSVAATAGAHHMVADAGAGLLLDISLALTHGAVIMSHYVVVIPLVTLEKYML